MSSQINATFEIKEWDEQPFDEAVGVAKLTKATVAKEYAGDVEGTSATEWLMAYHPDKSAEFVGLERIKGDDRRAARQPGAAARRHVRRWRGQGHAHGDLRHR